MTTITLATFSMVALLLAALGPYGALTHYVSQRTHEIGVRLALGAGTGDVVGGVLWRGAVMVVPGLAAGVFASLGPQGSSRGSSTACRRWIPPLTRA
ncbi:MAG TPA: FtsX-like permease family protein [Vicinamibacterales bacterium]|nr:FtsX-like permease family protein [Vicinamibacterales bacterium]